MIRLKSLAAVVARISSLSSVRPRFVGLLVVPLLAGCGFEWAPEFDEAVEPSSLSTMTIAPVDQALTFARVSRDGRPAVLLVQRYAAGVIEGVDLSSALERPVADPIDAFLTEGYERLATVAGSATTRVSFAEAELVMPVDLREHHIAAGTNFPEHANDVGASEQFLFPKLVAPTGWLSPVSAGEALLDYEAELAWVPLVPLAPGEAPEQMGLVLCNDFTDRETLLKHLDPGDFTSGEGFTTGKSFPGYLPVGNLFVVPRDHRAFARELTLALYVNGGLRQRERVSAMVWDIDELVRQVRERKDLRWEHRGAEVGLLEDGRDRIEARTLILSGTPSGTVFSEVTGSQKAAGFFQWLFFGWGQSVPDHSIDNYIHDAHRAGIYLQPGDRVDLHVERMGMVRSSVAP